MADRKLSALTELTAPATGDQFLVLDASEALDADKNKRILFGTLCNNIPDGSVTVPSLGFTSDTGNTGFYRSGANEIAVSVSDTYKCKFTATGFQLGTGTAAAQLHTFNTASGDDVVIENSESGAGEGPNIAFYRNSSSPADNDVLGTIEFRGKDDGGSPQSYAEITSGIVDASAASEDGRLDLSVTVAGTPTNMVRLQEGKVGVNETAAEAPIHVTNSDTQIVRLECQNNDASSGADIRMYRHRNGAVGQDNDNLSALFFRGHNDNGTASQRQIDYASIQSSIVDASNNTEDGKIDLKVQSAGTLTSMAAITAANVTLGSRPIIPTHTPSSATDTGIAGEIAWDASYLYVCTATDTWKRVALSTW